MSVFYDQASLVLVPSGYKASKVYAQKPRTTDGQLAFSRASTATRVNSSGLVEAVSSNVPRLDYTNSTCPKLLLEPQRTNLVTYSEQFDNAAWTKGGVGTFTSAITTGFTDPAGGTSAQRWLATIASVSDRAFVRQLTTLTSGAQYTISFWVKSNTASNQDIYFLFQGGAVQATTATTSWQRISYTATTSTTAVLVGIEAKDLAIDVLVYGFQLELGAYATSYVKTEASTVTRLEDVCNKTGISSLIGQTEGTLFLEMNINKRANLGGTGPNGLEIKDASASNTIIIGTAYGTNQTFTLSRINAGSFSTLLSTTNNALGTYKLAAGYSSAGFVFYVNGVQIGTSATLPPSATFADLGLMQVFGTSNSQGELVNQALLFKTRLTNAQLAELTAL